MAGRKSAALEVVKDQAEGQLTLGPESAEEEAPLPFNLEPLNDKTRAIMTAWGRGTVNRIGEMEMNGAPEWASFLREIFNTVGAFVGEN